jgi:hypothetical protein
MKDKLMSLCNVGCLDALKGIGMQEPSEVTLNCLNITAPQGVMDLYFDRVTLPAFVFLNAFVHPLANGPVAQLDLVPLLVDWVSMCGYCVFKSHLWHSFCLMFSTWLKPGSKACLSKALLKQGFTLRCRLFKQTL